MANNYSTFSVEFKLPLAAAKDLERILNAIQDSEGAYEKTAGYPEWFTEVMFDDVTCGGDYYYGLEHFEVSEADKDGNVTVWAADWENDAGMFAVTLHYVMQHHDVPGEICINSAYGCSKLRIDEFGGVAYNVSKDGMHSIGTYQLARLLPRIQKAITKAERETTHGH